MPRSVKRDDIQFPAKHSALRDDVHVLGALVGDVLKDQGGDALFDLVEKDRLLAIRRRAGDKEAAAELGSSCAGAHRRWRATWRARFRCGSARSTSPRRCIASAGAAAISSRPASAPSRAVSRRRCSRSRRAA